MIPIKMIAKNHQSVCVEYEHDGLHRIVLPVGLVRDSSGRLPLEVLQMGVEVGVDWAAVLAQADFPGLLASEMHEDGLWVAEHLKLEQRRALDACLRAFRRVMSQLDRLEIESAKNSVPADSE